MRRLVYIGPGGERRFGPEDGLSEALAFRSGEAVELTDEDAALLLEGPHAREFAEAPETPTPRRKNPAPGSAAKAASSNDEKEA